MGLLLDDVNARSNMPVANLSANTGSAMRLNSKSPAGLLKRGLAFFVWAMLLASPSWGALEFANTVFEETAALGQKRVPFAFPFINNSEEPVEITAIRTSCGCTTSALDKKVYAPGESGVIEGSFTVGNRRGVQRNTVRVFTHDPATPAAELAVVVDIPTALTLRPGMTLWRVGEDPVPKSVRIIPNSELGVEVESVETPSGEFSVEILEPSTLGEPVKLLVAPHTTDTPARAMVQIKVRIPNSEPQNYYLHALVR